ncbi:hypothetical protein GCM10022225_71240 [Plantactinospora mayteni]|uniref:Uncharacterized protein n=1 Tax=Plantactinospora mayteni TaxID=566021 RepID=A0ABQ4F314_9ACTN|nr:hypothetical protein Pma05_78780 [Plantactinospora mayteni]
MVVYVDVRVGGSGRVDHSGDRSGGEQFFVTEHEYDGGEASGGHEVIVARGVRPSGLVTRLGTADPALSANPDIYLNPGIPRQWL